MLVVRDHWVRVAGEPLPRDSTGAEVQALLSAGTRVLAPSVGAVYATLLNDRRALAALGSALNEPPYCKPPEAPILYVKPRNTIVGAGATIAVPAGAAGVCVGGSLGVVLGRVAAHIPAEHALEYVAGYTIVADLAVPHDKFFRLPVRDVIRDGFCVLGPCIVGAGRIADPDALDITIGVAGRPPFAASTATAVRGIARLIADVTEFMTLAPGDVLTLGVPWGVPVAQAGDAVSIRIADWPALEFRFAAAAESAGGTP